MYAMWFDSVMNENGLIRLDNLQRLGLNAAELSARVGGARSYWHGMLAGQRPFGEKIARKIEERLELPRGSMDESEAVVAVATEPPYKPSPFAMSLARFYDGLPGDDVVRAQAFVNAMDAMRQATAQKSTPITDVPVPAPFAKQ